jgi:hypothetical protein
MQKSRLLLHLRLLRQAAGLAPAKIRVECPSVAAIEWRPSGAVFRPVAALLGERF